jgi:hypothetical protein
MHKRLTAMIENLTNCVEYQMEHLEKVNACELGEAVDMLKDLHEALYYHTITEAMKGEGAYGDWPVEYKKKDHHLTDGGHWETEINLYEGKSPRSRKMYMEAKHSKDKVTQLRELEKYMQELTTDMMEMMEDSSPEEKQYLEKKVSALASKIGQMK